MHWIRSASACRLFAAAAFVFSLAPAVLPQSVPASVPAAQQPAAPMHPAPPAPPLVMIDAAHGGTDPGAQLNPAIPEKDVTLMFARRLQQQLVTRGVSASLVRESDATLTTDQRAAQVNSIRPALYVCIHASSMGSGIRVFAAMLPVANDDRGPFVTWQTAQAGSENRSAWAQQQLTAAIQKMGFPVRAQLAPLQPLNNIAVPAIAIEVAPSNGSILQLASEDYQNMVAAAVASALGSMAPSLRMPSFQTPVSSGGGAH